MLYKILQVRFCDFDLTLAIFYGFLVLTLSACGVNTKKMYDGPSRPGNEVCVLIPVCGKPVPKQNNLQKIIGFASGGTEWNSLFISKIDGKAAFNHMHPKVEMLPGLYEIEFTLEYDRISSIGERTRPEPVIFKYPVTRTIDCEAGHIYSADFKLVEGTSDKFTLELKDVTNDPEFK